MNKNTKNVEWIEVTCQKCGCLISRENYHKINANIALQNQTEILCEAHYIKTYALPGIIKLQAIGKGKYTRSRKDIIKKERMHMKELMRKLPRIVDNHQKKFINYDNLSFNLYAEFPEFSKVQLDRYEELFRSYDIDKVGKITIDGLGRMMEKLQVPQTHLRKLFILNTFC